jgi:hypothetical protein
MGVTIIDNTQTINNATWKVQPDVLTDERGIVKENGTIHYIDGKLKYHANGVIKEVGLGTDPSIPIIAITATQPFPTSIEGDRYLFYSVTEGVIDAVVLYEYNGTSYVGTTPPLGQLFDVLSTGKTIRWTGTGLEDYGLQKSLQDLILSRKTDSYTLVATDNGQVVEMNKATANTLTVPQNIFSAGQQVLVTQYGAGQTTIAAGAGVTLRSSGGKLKLTNQYATATLIFISASEAYVSGNLTA